MSCTTICPKIAIVGDSIATAIAYQLKIIRYNRAITVAVSGHTIENQTTAWNALSAGDKLTFDYVFVQVGVNNYAQTAAVKIPLYQTLINTIRASISQSCKIIGCTMTPMRGATNGYGSETYYPHWAGLNAAIRGEGVTPITGLDSVCIAQTTNLNDGSDGLSTMYNNAPTLFIAGDKLHPNVAGNIVNAQALADCIV